MPIIQVLVQPHVASSVTKSTQDLLSDDWRFVVSQILEEDINHVAAQWITVLSSRNMEDIEIKIHFSARKWGHAVEEEVVPLLIAAMKEAARRSARLEKKWEIGVWPQPIFHSHYGSVHVGAETPSLKCPKGCEIGTFTYSSGPTRITCTLCGTTGSYDLFAVESE